MHHRFATKYLAFLFPPLFLTGALMLDPQEQVPPRTGVENILPVDFNGDGAMDFVLLQDGVVRLFRNGEKGFLDVTQALGLEELGVADLRWQDLTGDGLPELILLRNHLAVLRNAEESFEDITQVAGLADVPGGKITFVPSMHADRLDLLVENGDRFLFFQAAAGSDLRYEKIWGGTVAELGASMVVHAAEESEEGSKERSTDPGAGPTSGGGIGATPVGTTGQTVIFGSPACSPGVEDHDGSCLSASSLPELGKLYPLSQDLFVSPGGQVGMGTTGPGNNKVKIQNDTSNLVGLNLRIGNAANGKALFYGAHSGTGYGMRVQLNNTSNGRAGLLVDHKGTGNSGRFVGGKGVYVKDGDNGNAADIAQFFAANGAQGIGIGRNRIQAIGSANHQDINLMPKGNGKVIVDGRTVTDVLEITGGADLAESFDISGENVQPGMVVTIDSKIPGQLILSSKPYDRTVAGVISGANGIKPGLTLADKGTMDGEHPVAMTGRVYVWCEGPVVPGDLLTTSNVAGHAMAVKDHARANGAILGKAMTELEEGRGLVLMVVALQ